MAETPEQLFARLMPGVDIKSARRTPKGYPYVEERAEFEPGTYGQRSEGRPLVRLSPKADKFSKPHELKHVEDLYEGTKYPAYDEGKMSNLYKTYGLSPEESEGLAYGMAPQEQAARAAAGDPGRVFLDLMSRVEALRARRKSLAPRGPTSGGIGDPSRRSY